MNKETRKTNLKKLQLPKNGNARNSKQACPLVSYGFQTSEKVTAKDVASSSSESYINILQNPVFSKTNKDEVSKNRKEEDISENAKSRKRTKLSTFLIDDKKKISCHYARESLSDDFETPRKDIKKAVTKTKLKSQKNQKSKLKTNFFQNEKLFSEIATQYSIAENFNPDEIQLALAISKSVTETSGKVHDFTGDNKETVRTNLKRQLQTYGFRCNDNESTFNFSSNTKTGKGKKPTWTNKFTALTLRNPAHQYVKLNEKIEELIAKQFSNEQQFKIPNRLYRYEVFSGILRKCQTIDSFIRESEHFSTTEQLEKFFVEDLFTISRVQPGYLLKQWSLIQGRDFSPDRHKKKSEILRKHHKVYAELEEFFSSGNVRISGTPTDSLLSSYEIAMGDNSDFETQNVNKSEHKQEADILDSFIESKNDTDLWKKEITNYTSLSNGNYANDVNSSARKKCRISRSFSQGCLQLSNLIKNSPDIIKSFNPILLDNTNDLQSQKLSNRSTSPDIFCDSESDNDICPDSNPSIHTFKNGIEKLESSSREEDCCTSAESYVNGQRIVLTEPEEGNVRNRADLQISKSQNQISSGLTQNDRESDDSCIVLSDDEVNYSLWKAKKSCDKETEEHLDVENRFFRDDVNELKEFSFLSLINSEDVDVHEKPTSNSSIDVEKSLIRLKNECSASHVDLATTSLNIPIKIKDSNSSFDELGRLNPSSIKRITDKENNKDSSDMPEKHFNSQKSVLTEPEKAKLLNRADMQISKSQSEISSSLTQNDGESDDSCIILSDDEVNYSLWKAKSCDEETEEYLGMENRGLRDDENELKEFSFIDMISSNDDDVNQMPTSNSPIDLEKSLRRLENEYTASQIDLAETPMKIKNTRSSFVEMDYLDSTSHFKSPTKVSRKSTKTIPKPCKALSESFLAESSLESLSKKSPAMKHFSSSHLKVNRCGEKLSNFMTDDDEIGSYSDLDEIDKLIYGSPHKMDMKKPTGLDQLLTGEISFRNEIEIEVDQDKATSAKPSTLCKQMSEPAEEFQFNGRIYMIRKGDFNEMPDYQSMDEATLQQHLNNFGIRRLKHKHAVKILEHIYNQTHPFFIEKENIAEKQLKLTKYFKTIESSNHVSNDSKYNLQDCCGAILLRNSDGLSAELNSENYILQTNVNKKILQALIPLHIAWFNLVQSNTVLHEAILNYEPIELQEIYEFFKKLGFRYNPKDMKSFFDSRSIIFRYDIGASGNNHRTGRNVKQRSKNKFKHCMSI